MKETVNITLDDSQLDKLKKSFEDNSFRQYSPIIKLLTQEQRCSLAESIGISPIKKRIINGELSTLSDEVKNSIKQEIQSTFKKLIPYTTAHVSIDVKDLKKILQSVSSLPSIEVESREHGEQWLLLESLFYLGNKAGAIGGEESIKIHNSCRTIMKDIIEKYNFKVGHLFFTKYDGGD